ncbi:amidohydrolase family protein [Marinicella sp. S1101]|uniref:metal-dependent hydrolase family protein n=1 Tax=Marinicella marina TaxID=2996016 RepID=UPI002260A4E0|nr:amidohydrolase family protein [Marinicella marina]MCX7552395.1 amidohydrolase family protein [Marinicella marina]MDJ1139270.1 amidohydrolase family protein [Marinicella marina]
MKLFLILLAISLNLQAETTLIKAKGYIDVQQGQLIQPANIVIDGETITAVNPQNLPAEAKVIDLGEQIILPGLMDMHAHLDLDFNGGFDDILTKESASKGALRGAKNAEKTLLAGFTTVRNIGQVHITTDMIDVALAQASDAGWIVAPRIIPAGHMISIQGGHGDLTLGLAADLIEQTPKNGIINGADEAIAAVRYQIKNGAKVIKMHATAGVLSMEDSVGAQQLSDAEMQAIVEETHRHGMRVAAHAHGTEGIKAAIRAGVHSIEHGSLLDDEGIKMMKKNKVYLVPTTGCDDFIDTSTLHPKLAEKAEYVLPLAQANLKKAIKAGVPIALGTDSPLIPHGQNAYELSAMMEHGMDAADALRTATINAADLLGKADRGQIKAGLLADLIAVDENPLENIKTTENVQFVMKGGKIYKN